ncbi:unnamed protein product [Dibothriocephalus latus]|uniref:Uncharacterized protein n=1 Tax=Dibothriocephalus latus TaxID=60516 RepID=A0A3P7MJF7_DIBLA|nr:unnamed protein product [Dibothriocephalus latus]
MHYMATFSVLDESRWPEQAPLAFVRRHYAAADLKADGSCQTLLGVLGGYNGRHHLSSCEVYDVTRDRWYSLPDMQKARAWVPAASCQPGDCRMFVFGGYNSSGALASVEYCHL